MSQGSITIDYPGTFTWRFTEVLAKDNSMIRSNGRILQLKSDLNIGFEKSLRSKVLEAIETFSRSTGDETLIIKSGSLPVKSPHHLDDQNEFIRSNKIDYKEISIFKINKGRSVVFDQDRVQLSLDKEGLLELFFRLYTCFEIYATFEDNILEDIDFEGEKVRMVIWGVINGKPIYY